MHIHVHTGKMKINKTKEVFPETSKEYFMGMRRGSLGYVLYLIHYLCYPQDSKGMAVIYLSLPYGKRVTMAPQSHDRGVIRHRFTTWAREGLSPSDAPTSKPGPLLAQVLYIKSAPLPTPQRYVLLVNCVCEVPGQGYKLAQATCERLQYQVTSLHRTHVSDDNIQFSGSCPVWQSFS